MAKEAQWSIWEGVEIPSFDQILKDVDYSLMQEFSRDATGVLWGLYFYFDSVPEKPMTPRELIQFWEALSSEERLLCMTKFCY